MGAKIIWHLLLDPFPRVCVMVWTTNASLPIHLYIHTSTSTHVYFYCSWQRKLALVKTSEESSFLYHELGRCQLELGNYSEARDFGEKSLATAREAQDQIWQLNASVLVAQAESEFSFYCIVVSINCMSVLCT